MTKKERLVESSFSNRAVIPYMINNDPIDIGYRGNKNTNRFESFVDLSIDDKIRVSPIRRDYQKENSVLLASEVVSDIASPSKVRIKAVYENEKESPWVVYKEKEYDPVQGENQVRIKGVSYSFAKIEGKYGYSNIINSDIDLFNMLSDIIDVAIMASDQVEVAYSIIIEDLVLLELEDLYPGIAKILDEEEFKHYTLEDKIEYASTISLERKSYVDKIRAELLEMVRADSSSAKRIVEEFFLLKSKDIASLLKVYGVDDDEFSINMKDRLSHHLFFDLRDMYKKVKEILLPVQFDSMRIDPEQGNLRHLSVGDIAYLRSKDSDEFIKIFKPMLQDVYVGVIKEIVELEGGIYKNEKYHYSFDEERMMEFKSSIKDFIFIMQAEEEMKALIDLTLDDEDARGKFIAKENVSVLTILDDYEMSLIMIYDRFIKKIEELETKHQIDIEIPDRIPGIITEYYQALFDLPDIEENKGYQIDEKGNLYKNNQYKFDESYKTFTSEEYTTKKNKTNKIKESLNIEILSEAMEINNKNFLLENIDDLTTILEEAATSSKNHEFLSEEDVSLIFKDIMKKGYSNLSEERIEDISLLMFDLIERYKTLYQGNSEKVTAGRVSIPGRIVKPNLKDLFTSYKEYISRRDLISLYIEEDYRDLWYKIEDMMYTTASLGGETPLGIFTLGKHKLGYKKTHNDADKGDALLDEKDK